MAKYTSGRQKNIKVGIASYSENRTSLEVIGKVGIGTTNATSNLHVVGNQKVTGVSTFGNGTTGVKIDGVNGIVTSTNPGVTTVTFVGNLTGTASTASFASTAFSISGVDFGNLSVAFAEKSGISTDVIGGIASVSQLSVSGFSTVGILTATKIGIGTTNPTSELVVIGNSRISGISTFGNNTTGVLIDGINGIVTSTNPGVTTVTYFGNLKGNSDTTGKLKTPVNIGGVSFDGSANISLKGVDTAGDQNTSGTAASAGNLNFGVSKGIYFRDISGSNATTSNNLTFDGNNLKVSGITTVGSGDNGIRIDGTTGIISSSNPGVTTVTFVGNLIGTAQVDVTNVTNTSNVIGGIASVTELSVSGLSTVGVLTATKIGIGTSTPTAELVVIGNIFSTGISTLGTVKISSGIIESTTGTAVTLVGIASTAIDVIGGIGSISRLSVSGISTFGNGTTGVKIDGVNGIVTSTNPGVTTVTFVGNLTGTASTASFASTAFSISGVDFGNLSAGSAKTATDVIGGIGSLSRLSVSGISTFGNSTTGVKIDGVNGIVTSSNPGVTTVTFVGNLTGTASTASFASTAFSLQGFTPATGSVGFASTATNLGAGNTGSLPYQISPGITTFLSAAATNKQILLYNKDSNKPEWGNVSDGAGFSVFGGITVKDENQDVGTASSITTLNFVGSNIKAIATAGSNGIATITVSDNLVGTALSISGISTFGNASIGVKIDGVNGIVTSSNPGVTTVTFVGNLTGTASTAGFAATAFSLNGFTPATGSVGFATTAINVIGGIGSVTQLSVSGFSTVGVLTATKIGIGTTNPTSELVVIGNSNISGIVTVGVGSTGIVINGNTGIISSSNPGVTTVTYFGDGSKLTGIKGAAVEFQASTEQPVFPTLASSAGVSSIGISTTNSNALSFIPSTGSLGVGTTNPISKLTVNGNVLVSGTGIVTASKYNGDLVFGTPSDPGFKSGPVAITSTSSTRDSVNEINFILGKLVPKPPTTIAGVALTVTTSAGTAFLCNGFTPVNNATTAIVVPSAGTSYKRNTSNTVSSVTLTQYGPGDSGTVTALLNNTVGVGTTTLSTGSNNGTYGALVISNDKDASFSTRNTGIVSGFYEIYDAQISNLSGCPDGFNCISIRQGTNETSKTTGLVSIWYEDGSTVSAPVLSAGTLITPSPSTHVIARSSGIPHYTESASNAFTYVLTCQNATGDMYSSNTFCTGGSATSGFQASGNKTYTSFTGGTNPPVKDFGVGTGVTTLISQTPQNSHIQLPSPVSFSSYTASTPYGGSNTPSITLSKSINIMGSTAIADPLYETKIDEDNIKVTLNSSSPGTRVRAISGVDNPIIPTGYSITASENIWDSTLLLTSANTADFEATVVGGTLKHDQTDYSSNFLPIGPNYSGRSSNQYFQLAFIRTTSKFSISVVGTYTSCWVCQPNNTDWKNALSDTNGWANMFLPQSGDPSNLNPGCALAGPMNQASGTFNCTFGTFSSSGGGGLILIRFKLTAGQSMTKLTIANSTQ